ncbi:MAG: hypothetical protein ACOX4I_00595 [Anaerovoracaceae bacterium]|jgi:hypothetical protein
MTTVIPELDITIDECLILIPQLISRKAKLETMAARLPKERESMTGYGSNTFVDYIYANYDIAKAESDYEAACEELTRAQTSLDKINANAEFEIEL